MGFHAGLCETCPDIDASRHRVLAELLEQGTRSTLTIPSAYPTPAPSAALVAAQALDPSQLGLEAMRALGLNPNQALQHPGFYYYMAARCTERRRERFLSALEGEVRDILTLISTVLTSASERRSIQRTRVRERAQSRPPNYRSRGSQRQSSQ